MAAMGRKQPLALQSASGWGVWDLLGGGLLGLYVMGFATRWGDARAAWVGIGLTIAYSTWTLLSSRGWLPTPYRTPFDAYYTTLFANSIMFVAILLSAVLLFRPRVARQSSGESPV